MKLYIVSMEDTKWSTLSRFATKSVEEGVKTYVYQDGINFMREMIKTIQDPPKEMVVLCGRENHMTNALSLSLRFQQVFPSITKLESVL